MKKYCLFLSAIMLLFACNNREPVELKLSLPPGSIYHYTIETKTRTEQGIMGTTTQHQTTECTYEAAPGAGDSSSGLTVRYERMAMEMKRGDASVSYDTKDTTGEDPVNDMLGAVLRKPFSVFVSSKGDVLQVAGVEAIVDGIADTATPQGQQIRGLVGDIFNSAAVRAAMEQTLNFFPGHPVRPGESWKRSAGTSISVMNMQVDNEYRLTEISKGVAHIDVKAKITGNGAMSSPDMQNMQLNVAGTQSGTLFVEVATGVLRDGRLTQQVEGDITAMGMKVVPVKIGQETHVTAKKQ